MTPAEFRTSRRRTMNHDLTFADQMLNAALGLGEAGELQGLIKKAIYHQHEMDEEWIRKAVSEAGDMYFYLDWFLELLGLTPGDAMEFNKRKLEKRYPNGFSAENSRNRPPDDTPLKLNNEMSPPPQHVD